MKHTVCFLIGLTLSVFTVPPLTFAQNCDYYAAPNATGSGDGSSESNAYQIADFWTGDAAPGRVLCLVNGTYQGANSMIFPPVNLAGTPGNYITVKALHDGMVTLDGQGARRPVLLQHNDYFIIEGINGHNSNATVFRLDHADHNIIRRAVGWDAAQGNHDIFGTSYSTGNLFEDVAGFGIARKIYSGSQRGNDLTCRRCWGRWEGSTEVGPKMTYTLFYNNYAMTIENSIGTWSGESMPQTYILNCPPGHSYSGCGSTYTNYAVDQAHGIFGVDGPDGNSPHSNSQILGSIAYLQDTDVFPNKGLYWMVQADDVLLKDNVAVIGGTVNSGKKTFRLDNLDPDEGGPANNLSAEGLTAINGAPYIAQSQWQGNVSNVDEGATLGDVSSVWTSSTGAQVCKRYVDRTLTNEPLWPWPMDQRIYDAMVQAQRTPFMVTNVIESLLGPIPAECRSVTVSDDDMMFVPLMHNGQFTPIIIP